MYIQDDELDALLSRVYLYTLPIDTETINQTCLGPPRYDLAPWRQHAVLRQAPVRFRRSNPFERGKSETSKRLRACASDVLIAKAVGARA